MGRETVRIVPITEAEPLARIADLAGVIWRACYPGIISLEQIDYMLARMYAPEVLQQEVQFQGIHYHGLVVDDTMVGFASLGPTSEPGVMKLHKLYLLPEWQGRGLGSRLLQHCEQQARAAGAQRLILAVNKRNTKARAAYEKNGYAIITAVVADIGGGFHMDDFIMAKALV